MIECINPNEMREGDLIAYLHGDASPQVDEHVAHCPYCSQQVEQLRMVDAQLLAAFYRQSCPTPEVLADFVFNRLPAVERLRVAAHVRDCETCAEEVASVRDLADETPPSLLARLREALALALVARPVAQVGAPVRGEGWQGRVEIKDLVVTLSFQAGQLTGRMHRRDTPVRADYSGQVWLIEAEATQLTEPRHDEIDAGGHFQFTGLLAGAYSLLMQIGGQDIVIESIQIE